jgi:hypothetical protein
VAGDFHGQLVLDAGPLHVPHRAPPQVVEQEPRETGAFARFPLTISMLSFRFRLATRRVARAEFGGHTNSVLRRLSNGAFSLFLTIRSNVRVRAGALPRDASRI